jgi:hypothetical protein
VRRFDVFAEYTRLEKLREGLPADAAKGYAVWLAKVVAARKFGRLRPAKGKHPRAASEERAGAVGAKFRSLGGTEQTDEVFDKDIVQRMGKSFYTRVFSPAIKKAFDSGKSYKQIRDTIRKTWQV